MPRPSLRFDAVLVQAVIAGALSFAHLHDIAEAAGQTGWKAWAYPISVDLLLVAAWRRLRTLAGTDTPRGAAWAWFTIALAASLGANVATAGLLDLSDVPNWLRVTVAGWPALAFLGGTLLAHTPTADTHAEEVPAEEHHQEAAAELLAPAATLPTPAAVEVPAKPAPLPAPSAEAPAPAQEPASPDTATETAPATTLEAKAPALPPALLVQARKFSADHKRRTGYHADADTLRARLNLPAPMAAALAAQLT